jgi:fucose 4-O-acetylase-like acetyltransferase
MNPVKPTRNEFVDYAKGILIFLVTLGHVIQFVVYRNDGFYGDYLFRAIYLFHMPLFMALAGYVTCGSLSRTAPGEFIIRRIINLLLPIFCWSVLAESLFFAAHHGRDLPQAARDLADLFFGSLWFLWALFEASVIVAVARTWRWDKAWFAVASSVLITLLVPDFGKLYLFKFTYPFFCLGYLAAQQREVTAMVCRNKPVLFLAGVAGVMAFLGWREETYVYVSKMTVTSHTAGIIIFRLAAGIVASIAALWLMHLLYQRLPRKWVIWLGNRSLYIFILQTYFFATLTRALRPEPPHALRNQLIALTLAPVVAALLAGGFGLASRMAERFPTMALLFFGRQQGAKPAPVAKNVG